MDLKTIETYDAAAARFATEWREQPAPDDMYALLRRYFHAGGLTADIGCGAGRDVAWLNANGFPAEGYDASTGLLAEAAVRYPEATFKHAALPELDTIANESFDNVLCETVIMHLGIAQIGAACARLVEILKPCGVLYLSWRVSPGEGQRDGAGRLYSGFDAALVLQSLGAATVVFSEDALNESSRKSVFRVIARRA